MKAQLAIFCFLLMSAAANDTKKRSIPIGYQSLNLFGNPGYSPFGHYGSLSHYATQAYPQPFAGKTTSADVAAAISAAKEATAAAVAAQQRVQAAREHLLIQEKIATAKEAAAHAAIQRSEAAAQVAAAIQRSEAAAAAAAAVQKSAASAAAASAASAAAAQAAGHYSSNPWSSKIGLNPWG